MDINTDVERGVRGALDRMRAAWDSGDAAGYAAEFTPDGTYVIFTGSISRGRDEIRADHIPLFERWQKGSRLSVRVLDIKQLGPDVAIVLTEGAVVRRPGDNSRRDRRRRIRHDKVQTYVFVRTPNDSADSSERVWKCTAFQNTKRSRIFAALAGSRKGDGGQRGPGAVGQPPA